MNDKSPIFRSLAMIEEKIRERLTVEMLAEEIHFSKSHYQRIFREAVGDTVMGYVTRRRLFLAKEELAGTKDSVLDIALRYGYDSHEGFTRSFKAHLGVTPTEYRKYHSAIRFPETKKEECTMAHAKHMEELMKELSSLIVQAKETAENTRRFQATDAQAAAFYGQVWELAARRAENMAEELGKILERAAVVSQEPDEIAARFLLVKAMDDAVFEAGITAFQVGLMIARAVPEHRAVFAPLCAQYDSLAQNARIKSSKTVDFLNELSDLIFQEMRKEAEQRIQNAVRSGRAAAEKLSDPALPYGYIADEVMAIAEELDSLALEDVRPSSLTDAVFKLETIRFAADMDMLRAPQHGKLFDGILDFKEKLDEAAEFFRNLTGDGARRFPEAVNKPEEKCAGEKIYKDLAMQEGVVLFCLKGEIRKLGETHLDTEQQTAFHTVCDKMDRAIKLSIHSENGEEKDKISELLREAYDALTKEAERLDPYGGAISYLAEEVKKLLQSLMK